ncbi:MAG: hypothetical protein QOJ14_295, partial [Thermoleophilaceae bacterium]|nr:hypothetical protein [Thermoleophilaceae bacterium]
MRRRLVAALLTAAGVAALGAPAAAAEDALKITGSPELIPRFDPDTTDFVSRCGATGHLTLSFDVPPGETTSLDEGPAKGGRYQQDVKLGSGQQVVINARLADRNAHYHVRCLPADFPPWTATHTGATQAEWYLVTPAEHLAVFFDPNGVPVWWRRVGKTPFNPTFLPDGDVAWYEVGQTKFGTAPDEDWDEQRLDGTKVRSIRAVGN